MNPLTWEGPDGLRTATATATELIEHVRLWRPDSTPLLTGAYETAVVILHGTFDLSAGATAWQARGARKAPFEGRPMAVFLPPETEFRADNGDGELLLVGARQPDAAPAAEAREALSQSPLLPLAGSGKAFDPASGQWMPNETFPSAAESLPPRRMLRIAVGDVTVERVFAADYKAATLTVDEIVLQAGQSIALGDIPQRPPHRELLVFARSDSEVVVRGVDESCTLRGDAAFTLATGADTTLSISAGTTPAYLLLAYAGK